MKRKAAIVLESIKGHVARRFSLLRLSDGILYSVGALTGSVLFLSVPMVLPLRLGHEPLRLSNRNGRRFMYLRGEGYLYCVEEKRSGVSKYVLPSQHWNLHHGGKSPGE